MLVRSGHLPSVLLALGLLTAGWPRSSAAQTGMNFNFSLPLHAELGIQGCGPLAVDCQRVMPTVNIPPDTGVTIYLLAANYTALGGLQTAFEWDPGWVLIGSIFNCVPGQLNAVVPSGTGGPTAGTVSTAFDCVTTGTLLVIGRLIMTAGPSGCLRQVVSTYPFGTCALDCTQGINDIPTHQSWRLGRICVLSGGNWDACGIPEPAVRGTTWGEVKATYR